METGTDSREVCCFELMACTEPAFLRRRLPSSSLRPPGSSRFSIPRRSRLTRTRCSPGSPRQKNRLIAGCQKFDDAGPNRLVGYSLERLHGVVWHNRIRVLDELVERRLVPRDA